MEKGCLTGYATKREAEYSLPDTEKNPLPVVLRRGLFCWIGVSLLASKI